MQEIDNQAIPETEVQHVETNTPETSSPEQAEAATGSETAATEERLFTQSELNEIVAKRLARDKEKEAEFEQLKANHQRMIETFQNFGKTPEQIQQEQQYQHQQPGFDPNRPLTLADIYAMQEEQARIEKETKYNQELQQAAKEYEGFEKIVFENPLVKSITNPVQAAKLSGLSQALERMEKPSKFLFYATKNHAEEFNKIGEIADPIQQAMAVARLEVKIKDSAVVPAVSGAPNVIGEDIEASGGATGDSDIQSLRRQLLG